MTREQEKIIKELILKVEDLQGANKVLGDIIKDIEGGLDIAIAEINRLRKKLDYDKNEKI